MDTMLQDIRYSIRALGRSPGFTAAALLTLAIGTGANAAVFSFVNALLLRPAPVVRDPASLYSIFTTDFSSGPYGSTSFPDFLSVRTGAQAFSGVAAFSESAAVLRKGEVTERIRLMTVSGEFFDVAGIQPAYGRLLVASDAAASASPVAVIGHDLWRRVFGADPAVVGQSVSLDGRPVTVVGVVPAKFNGLNLGGTFEVWTPLIGRASAPDDRGRRQLSMIGRLREGATTEAAQAQLDGISTNLARAYPVTNRGTLQDPMRPRGMTLLRHSRIHPGLRGMVVTLGAVLMSAVGLVLLVACANIANLLLARATARTREIAIRLALGASRGRLLRQLLTESLLLGVIGGAVGVLFALWTADMLPAFFPAEQARLLDAHVDMRVVFFTAAVSVLAATLFGLAPALHAIRPAAQGALRSDGGRTSDGRARYMRAALVLAQVMLAFVLLVSSGLLVQSLTNALRGDLGFATRDAVVANLDLSATSITPDTAALYFEQALDRVRALPGIEAASLTRSLPLGGRSRRGFSIEGYQPRRGEDSELNFNVVDRDYFETMRIARVEGRTFDRRDVPGGALVAIVNDTLAQRYFGGRAVGRRLRDARGSDMEIVGVVRTGKHRSVQEPPLPIVYYPYSQGFSPSMTLVARTAGDPSSLSETIRRTVQGTHADFAVFRVMTLADHLAEALGGERLTAALVTAAGTMALLLAIVGVYGVISYGVARRRKEIGVRVALGAAPLDVVRLVVAEGLKVTLIGIALGTVAALGATQLLATMLFGVEARDVRTFASAAVLLAAVAVFAAWMPARRAVRLDPVAALRQE